MRYKMVSDIKLNKKQNEAFSSMVAGKNVFVTGSAGTGKSKLLQVFIGLYKNNKIMGITSTTGVSALIFGGTTLHSYLGIGLGTGTVDNIVKKILSISFLRKRWNQLEVLLIDEISMLSPELFDKLELIARTIRHNENPFGGIQLILSGDYCQLPSVNSDKFCFEAVSWDKCISNVVLLTEIMRQKDVEFQECLNEVRIGRLSMKTRQVLESRVGVKLINDIGIKPTQLYSTNASADKINTSEIDKLEDTGVEYKMEMYYTGIGKNKEFVMEKYRKSIPAVDLLELCVGAQVMLIFNLDLDNGLVNGSRGIVTGFIEDIPVVKFLGGQERIIDYHTWDWIEDDKKIGKTIQIPLKLAWAITCHRSQGSTLDYVEVNLSDCFEYGQSYVALSRVKNIEGLSILDIDFDRIKAHPKVVKYYASFKT